MFGEADLGEAKFDGAEAHFLRRRGAIFGEGGMHVVVVGDHDEFD